MIVCSILGLSAIHELNHTSFPFCSPAAECMCDLRLAVGCLQHDLRLKRPHRAARQYSSRFDRVEARKSKSFGPEPLP